MSKKKIKLAILGSKGIPNNYGGFEQCAEKISLYFKNTNIPIDVYVYCPISHTYKSDKWQGINLVHIKDYEKYPLISSLAYDYGCVIDAKKRKFDIIIQLGYSPSGLFYKILKKENIPIITNMGGMEWKRSKWGIIARNIIKYSEKLAVKYSDMIISDNLGIKEYIDKKYNIDSKYIAYGAEIPYHINDEYLSKYNLEKESYYLVISRIQKDNNIEMIINGYLKSYSNIPLIIIGSIKNNYGKYLKQKYKYYKNIRFIGGVYELEELNAIRRYCKIYFHGHSAGGTNPSLLEAMAIRCKIVAHNNIFNRYVLQDNAIYFNNDFEVANIINNFDNLYNYDWQINNLENIKNNYQWDSIGEMYLKIILEIAEKKL